MTNREITLPFEFTPRSYQLPVLRAMGKGVKRAVLVWNRRSGKDKTALNFMIKEMFLRVGVYYYFFPTYAQGKKDIWDNIDKDGFRFLDHFPKEIVKRRNDMEMKIETTNGSLFQIVGTDDIDRIVGSNPMGCVFSEYAVQKPNAWNYIRPILAENNGWAIFVFTPRGMNHAWKLLQQAKETDSRWFWQILTVEETKTLSPDSLAAEKRQMPEALFRQEYYCEFVEGAGAFFRRVKENIKEDSGDHAGHVFQIGVDLAKYQDWTVITPFCLNCFHALQQDRFNQVDWNLQKARIQAAAYKYNNAKVVADATGVGDPIVEDLSRSGLAVEPFKFTENSRREVLNNLAIMLEQDRMKMVPDDGLQGELQSFMFTLQEGGKLKMGVSEGLTDDRVMSLALAVWGTTQPVRLAKQEDFHLYVQDFS